jgi:L,D-transpeptidase catalytic domain
MNMRLQRLLTVAFAALAALFFMMADAQATRVDIVVSKPGQKMTVKVDGVTEYVWLVSTGAGQYETPTGTWRPFRMEAEHFSKEWDDAPMPHSIFFTGEGHAIHGSFHVKSLGRKASHGCVRLSPENAAILFGLVQKAGYRNTSVTIKGGFFDFGYNPSKSFADVGRSMDNTIFNSGSRQKPKKVALKCAVKNGKKTCRKPFVLFGFNG